MIELSIISHVIGVWLVYELLLLGVVPNQAYHKDNKLSNIWYHISDMPSATINTGILCK